MYYDSYIPFPNNLPRPNQRNEILKNYIIYPYPETNQRIEIPKNNINPHRKVNQKTEQPKEQIIDTHSEPNQQTKPLKERNTVKRKLNRKELHATLMTAVDSVHPRPKGPVFISIGFSLVENMRKMKQELKSFFMDYLEHKYMELNAIELEQGIFFKTITKKIQDNGESVILFITGTESLSDSDAYSLRTLADSDSNFLKKAIIILLFNDPIFGESDCQGALIK